MCALKCLVAQFGSFWFLRAAATTSIESEIGYVATLATVAVGVEGATTGAVALANADKLQLWHKIVAEIYYWLKRGIYSMLVTLCGRGRCSALSALWR